MRPGDEPGTAALRAAGERGLLAAPMPTGAQPAAPRAAPADALDALAAGAVRWRARGHGDLADLLLDCCRALAAEAPSMVAAAAAAKGWDAAALADEWAGGPLPVARCIRLLHDLHRGLAAGRLPRLRPSPARPGAAAFAALPAHGLGDPLLLAGHRAAIHGDAGLAQREPVRRGDTALVLGAGNVTATPLLDVLHQVFLEGRAVLLKPSPLHARLGAAFERALAPLVRADLLRVVGGNGALGQQLARDPRIAAVHLTGALATWDALRADPRLAGKTVTAEVGCCTPVVVVPGRWRSRDLDRTAAQLAAYVACNGGATCLAPRVVLTAARWPQRDDFLGRLARALAAAPARVPFHPLGADQYARAAGERSATAALAPRLRRNLDATRDLALLQAEHFAPVLLELPVEGDSPEDFLARAAACVRERVYGALAAYVFAASAVRAAHRRAIDLAIASLPHGTVVVNGWAGLGYGLGTAPWGVRPDADPRHGVGWTRGTLCLAPATQVVVEAPLRPRPLPPWLPAHRRGTATLRALTRYYLQPSLPRLAAAAALALSSP